jgi:HAD superfamily hydrolase (TIGR01459 family)
MTLPPRILGGLREIAGQYDALICDVWGVLHNGRVPYRDAAEALRRFRAECGPVVLLSNAPRPLADLEDQFRRIGVPLDCYDAIVTSGMAAREDVAARAARTGARILPMLHIGPERDRGVFDGLAVACVGADAAEIALCTGLWDDDRETPEDYRALLTGLAARGLPLLCANPDIVVQRGDTLVYCAGALAQLYESLGGPAIYFGKPHRPIYALALEKACAAAGRPVRRPLAVGDGAETDIRGANTMGWDAVFIAGGVHAAELGEFTAQGVAQLLAMPEIRAMAAMAALVW